MKTDFSSITVFKSKNGKAVTYEDLLRDIYENSEETRGAINKIIEVIIPLLPTLTENSVAEDITDMIKQLSELAGVHVKNDDLLVKVAGIISRIVQKEMGTVKSESEFNVGGMSDEEREQILENARKSMKRETMAESKSD